MLSLTATARTFFGRRMSGSASKSIGYWNCNESSAPTILWPMITNALLVFCVSFLITGCMTAPQPGGGHSGATAADTIGQSSRHTLEPEIEERVLALDPENVTSEQIRDVLSKTPAPRIINIHGGILPVQGYLISFSQFLKGMGYPEGSIRNLRD